MDVCEAISNSSPTQKYPGVTCPISLSDPLESELESTEKLMAVLKSYEIYETDVDLYDRLDILSSLNNIAREWIRDCALKKGVNKEMAENLGGHIRTFGSFRLGVHTKGGDIDSLMVCPKYIDRNDFFSSFYERLNEIKEVTSLYKVEEAYVPLLKFKYRNVEIDLLFARLNMVQVTENISLLDDEILRHLDMKCIRSLNGCRVADNILQLVPNPDTFKQSLRVIKLWAKNRGIYSNVLGFMGGVTWAIKLARVCQLYPNATPSVLILKFFFVYTRWAWPEPVILKKLTTESSIGLTEWNPSVSSADCLHLMPVITPAYPNQNSTFNISRSTKSVLMGEIKRGLEVCQAIFENKADWSILFSVHNFFPKYKNFIKVSAISKLEENKLEWKAFVESKLRHLVALLEKNYLISLAHINAKCYDSVDENEPGSSVTDWYIGLLVRKPTFDVAPQVNIDLTGELRLFNNKLIKNQLSIKIFNQSVYLIKSMAIKRKTVRDFLSAKELNPVITKPHFESRAIFPEQEETKSDSLSPRKRKGSDNELELEETTTGLVDDKDSLIQ